MLIPTGLALRWRSRAKTAESLLAQNAIVLTSEEDEAASEAEAASAETEPEADSSDEQEPLSYQSVHWIRRLHPPAGHRGRRQDHLPHLRRRPLRPHRRGAEDLGREGGQGHLLRHWPEDETSIQRIKKAAAAGHTIGMHSYSHDYEKIYTSVEDFLDDFYKLFVILRDEAGVTSTVFRFPGGSLNNYNQGVYKEIIAEMFAEASVTTTGTFR